MGSSGINASTFFFFFFFFFWKGNVRQKNCSGYFLAWCAEPVFFLFFSLERQRWRPTFSLLHGLEGGEDIGPGDNSDDLAVPGHHGEPVDLVLEHDGSGLSHRVGLLDGPGSNQSNVHPRSCSGGLRAEQGRRCRSQLCSPC